MPIQTIAVIAFNDISPFLLSMPATVFRNDPEHPEAPRFHLMVCSAETAVFRSNGGFDIRTRHTLRDVAQADIVIVPSWRDPEEMPPGRLLECLRESHGRGATIVGLCLGTFVLAAAGLLNGRPAATHWAWSDELGERYPEVRVRPDVLYVDDGDIVTSAGVAAGIDCCLHLLRRLHGAEAAGRVARRMVVPPHRQGGQAQFIDKPIEPGAGEDQFRLNLEWLLRHLDQPHTIDSLAERFVMSRRTFTRRFRQVTGATVGAWLLNQRLSLAQRLLEGTAKPIGLVAQEAGFGSEASLRLHFSRELKTSPARYRREFRGGGTERVEGPG